MSPKPEELAELLGMELYKVWTDFCGQLEERFSAAPRWNRGGMRWRYECQYRREGRRLCTLYARKGCAVLQIVFNREEQARFQAERTAFHPLIQQAFSIAECYPDGRRFQFGLIDEAMFPEFFRLLECRKK